MLSEWQLTMEEKSGVAYVRIPTKTFNAFAGLVAASLLGVSGYMWDWNGDDRAWKTEVLTRLKAVEERASGDKIGAAERHIVGLKTDIAYLKQELTEVRAEVRRREQR